MGPIAIYQNCVYWVLIQAHYMNQLRQVQSNTVIQWCFETLRGNNNMSIIIQCVALATFSVTFSWGKVWYARKLSLSLHRHYNCSLTELCQRQRCMVLTLVSTPLVKRKLTPVPTPTQNGWNQSQLQAWIRLWSRNCPSLVRGVELGTLSCCALPAGTTIYQRVPLALKWIPSMTSHYFDQAQKWSF